MKRLLILIIIVIVTTAVQAQKTFQKALYFYEDSVLIMPCGVISEVSILYFVEDTSILNTKKQGYYVAVLCADAYGKDFFKKRSQYRLTLDREYKKVEQYMPPDIFTQCMKQKNFYVLRRIKKVGL